MGWGSATKLAPVAQRQQFSRPIFATEKVDYARLVSLDFETFYDQDYTLSKLSTSEYIRDPRFEALMVGVKVGHKKRVVIPGPKIAAYLKTIPWNVYSLLCHNVQFDGFILSHHYGIVPKKYYCSLSMARGLHSNEIGAGLDEVARFYGRAGKLKGSLEAMKGKRYKDLMAEGLYAQGAEYCGVDVDEMLGIFVEMVPQMPADEMDLIDLTCRMFCDPVLKVDLPRVQAELTRELERREKLLTSLIDVEEWADKVTLTKAEKALTGKERVMLITKKVVGSGDKFASLLRVEGVEPPVKISKAWMAKPSAERTDEGKWAFAFAKDDEKFINLPDDVEALSTGLNLAKVADVKKLVARQARLRALVDCRLAVKSTTNITRAQRFLTAGANGMPLPCGYAYYRAHTGRWGGNNKMNMQNLTRGGELRLSILAAPGHNICVADSGQIEARVNGWLWGQTDLLDAFREADKWDKKTMGVARGDNRDAYCKFASLIYGREITTDDITERFVGKVCVLGLGFQMGAAKLQLTLAKGALGGPPVFFTLQQCKTIINTYRRKNHKIQAGWEICKGIIEDMAAGRTGAHGPISWEANTIWLPNGMSLKYPDLKKRLNDEGWDEWTYQSGDQRKKIYGGLLCENIVQALARIIVGCQMLTISRKYRVVMTTHDEVVTHVKAKLGPAATAFMLKVMKTPLAWCQDLPLFAEGGHDVNYSK